MLVSARSYCLGIPPPPPETCWHHEALYPPPHLLFCNSGDLNSSTEDIRRIKRSSFPPRCKILSGEKSNPVSYYYKTNGSLALCIQPYPVTGAALCRWVPASTVITARCDFPVAATQPCTTSKASHISFSSHHLLASQNKPHWFGPTAELCFRLLKRFVFLLDIHGTQAY